MLLLKGLIVASSLGFLAFAALGTAPAPLKLAPMSPLLLPAPEPEPAGVDQRYVVSSRAIACTPDEGCTCGGNQWMWSDGTQLTADELTRARGGSREDQPEPQSTCFCPEKEPACKSGRAAECKCTPDDLRCVDCHWQCPPSAEVVTPTRVVSEAAFEAAMRDHWERYGKPEPFDPEEPLPIDDIGVH